MEDMCIVVLDIGSSFIKAGFGGDEIPRAVFPNVIGKNINTKCQVMDFPETYVIFIIKKK